MSEDKNITLSLGDVNIEFLGELKDPKESHVPLAYTENKPQLNKDGFMLTFVGYPTDDFSVLQTKSPDGSAQTKIYCKRIFGGQTITIPIVNILRQ